MITFLLFAFCCIVSLVLGAYCEAPIKNAIEDAIDWAKARFSR